MYVTPLFKAIEHTRRIKINDTKTYVGKFIWLPNLRRYDESASQRAAVVEGVGIYSRQRRG